jgi:hypothetical protein
VTFSFRIAAKIRKKMMPKIISLNMVAVIDNEFAARPAPHAARRTPLTA